MIKGSVAAGSLLLKLPGQPVMPEDIYGTGKKRTSDVIGVVTGHTNDNEAVKHGYR